MAGILGNIKTVINGFFDSKITKQQNIVDSEPIVGDVKDYIFKEQIIAYVKEEFDRRQEERTPYELSWQLTQNFIAGNQYCDINEVSNTIYQQEKLFWWQQREVYNHIAAIVEVRLAKLGRLKPSMTVRPMTSDNDDIASAKVCKSIVDSTYQSQKMTKKISEANSWSEICGSVFYKSVWNVQGGQLIGYVAGVEGAQQPIYEGDVETLIVPAYEIFPDSCVNDGVDKCKSIIHAKAFTESEIEEIWNVKVAGTDIDVYGLGTTKVGVGGLGYNATVPTAARTVKEKSQIVMEYYELPSKTYPQGRLIIATNDELLYYGTCPYKIGENGKIALPFVRQECVKDSGQFFSTSIAERCLPIQRSYNALKNRKHEYLNRLAIGVLTYEENSLDDEEGLEEDGLAPGTMIARKQGTAAPTFIQNQILPPSFETEEEKLMNEFREISGVSELSASSNTQSGAGSGVALEILKESDDTRISLTADNVRQAILEVAKYWLRLYKQYSSGPRMARLVGKNNSVYVNYWDKNQLTSDDVVALTDDDLVQTPAQRKQQVMTLMQAGLFNDPDTGRMDRSTRAKVMEMLNYGNWEDGDDIDQMHISKATRENLDVQDAKEIRVRDFDNHAIHIEEHNKFRLSSEYDDLQEERPDLADYFDNHVLVHQQAMQMAQQQAAMEQMGMQQQQPQGNAKITNNNIKGPRDPINMERG
jgi:hypothetical protein